MDKSYKLNGAKLNKLNKIKNLNKINTIANEVLDKQENKIIVKNKNLIKTVVFVAAILYTINPFDILGDAMPILKLIEDAVVWYGYYRFFIKKKVKEDRNG